MSAEPLNESTVENFTLSWFTDLEYEIRRGEDIAPGEPAAERDAYGQVVYPPDLQAEATKLVLQQAEALCAEWVGGSDG